MSFFEDFNAMIEIETENRTKRELAHLLKIGETTLNNWIKGESAISLSQKLDESLKELGYEIRLHKIPKKGSSKEVIIMTKYFCDHCGKEIKYSEAVRFELRGQGTSYRGFDKNILLHKECISDAFVEEFYQELLAHKAEYEERKKAREKERAKNDKN